MSIVLFDKYLIHRRHHHFVIIDSFDFLFLLLTLAYQVLGLGLVTSVLGPDLGSQVLVNVTAWDRVSKCFYD